VQGKTVINGGGPNSVIMYNFNGQTVIVDVPDGSSVRLVAQGSTSVGSVSMEGNGNLEESGLTGAGFTTVEIPSGAQVILNGDFDEVNVEAGGANVNVTGGNITTMNIAQTATGAGVNLGTGARVSTLNANAQSSVTGQGQITNANVNVSGVTIAQTPTNTTIAAGLTANIGGQQQSGTTTPTPPPATGGGGGGTTTESVGSITVTTTPVDTSALAHDAGAVMVSLATATAGAEIRYTTNGDVPTAASTLYTVPFTVNNPGGLAGGTVTVKAMGIKTDMNNSAVAQKAIVYNGATTATVHTAAEFITAIQTNSVGTITLGGDIVGDVTATRTGSNNFSIHFGTYMLDGNLSLTAENVTSITFNGSAVPAITGNLTLSAASATVTNGINVGGSISVSDVGDHSWIEVADGNTITLTDSNGATIVIQGNPEDITIEDGADGINITASSPVTITVNSGATVNSITANGSAAGTMITNNGTVSNVTADGDVAIENNSGDITVAGTGTIGTSGTAGANVTGTAKVVTGISSLLGVDEATIRMGATVAANITGVVYDSGAGEYVNVTSANPAIVSVDAAAGLAITAQKPGRAAITVQVKNASDQVIKQGTIFVTVLPELLSAGSAAMAVPALGATPQTAAQVEAATANADYTVTGLTWNQALTAAGKFKAGETYTATVVLTSKNNKAFQPGAFTPTVAGAASVGTTTTVGTGVGNRVSFSVTFPATGPLAVTGIQVTTQPTKMSYAEGTDAVLELNGMVVTATNNDGSTNTATFTNGTAAGYTANPANGATLTNTAHHGSTVTITHTASGETATTGNLTVAALAEIDIAAIPGVTAPVRGATPIAFITETAQYTGTIAWTPNDNPFGPTTVYTATITLTPKAGYTFTGVAENFFTVAGATATNAADTGVITAVFPATEADPAPTDIEVIIAGEQEIWISVWDMSTNEVILGLTQADFSLSNTSGNVGFRFDDPILRDPNIPNHEYLISPLEGQAFTGTYTLTFTKAGYLATAKPFTVAEPITTDISYPDQTYTAGAQLTVPVTVEVLSGINDGTDVTVGLVGENVGDVIVAVTPVTGTITNGEVTVSVVIPDTVSAGMYYFVVTVESAADYTNYRMITLTTAPEAEPAPAALSFSPANGATGVALDGPVSIVFDRDLSVNNLSAVTITGPTVGTVPGVVATLAADKRTINMSHIEFGANSELLTVTIPENAVNNSQSIGNQAITWSFTTIEAGAEITVDNVLQMGYSPTATASTTEAGAGDWTSEFPSVASIDSSTGVITAVNMGTTMIRYTSSTSGKVNSLLIDVYSLPDDVSNSLHFGDGTTTINSNSKQLTGFPDPNPGETRTFSIKDGSSDVITVDHAGLVTYHADGGKVIVYELKETVTGQLIEFGEVTITAEPAPAPTVNFTRPDDGVVNVGAEPDTMIQFNENVTAVDLNGITISYNGGTETVTNVVATIDIGDPRTLNIAHDVLLPGILYTVTVPAGAVQNAAGTGNAEATWSFTTEAVPTLPEGILLDADAGSDFIAVLYKKADGNIYYNEADVVGAWGVETQIAAATEGKIAVDRTDNTHIAYTTAGAIGYQKFDGSTWTAEELISSNRDGTCSKPDIAVDMNGKAHITYTDTKGSTGDPFEGDDIMYATNISGSFVKTLIFYGYKSYISGTDQDGDLFTKGSHITVNSNGDYYIAAYKYYYNRESDYKKYYVNVKSNLGTGSTATSWSDYHQTYDLTTDGTRVYLLYKEDSFKTSELIVSGTTINFANTQTLTGTSVSSIATDGMDIVVAGKNATNNLLAHYNGVSQLMDTIVVGGISDVVYGGESFYAVYADSNDSQIKLYPIVAPPATYTVSFDSQGGSVVDPVTEVVENTTIDLPVAPSQEGYLFAGWYTEENGGGTQFTAATAVIADITVFARWIAMAELTGQSEITNGAPPMFDRTLTIGPGTVSPNTNLSYAWYRSTDNSFGDDTFVGEGTTYTPVEEDIGKYVINVATSNDATGNIILVMGVPVAKGDGPAAPAEAITGTFPTAATQINLASLAPSATDLEAAVAINGTDYDAYNDLSVDASGNAVISGLVGVTTSTKVRIRVKETATTFAGEDKEIAVAEAPLVMSMTAETTGADMAKLTFSGNITNVYADMSGITIPDGIAFSARPIGLDGVTYYYYVESQSGNPHFFLLESNTTENWVEIAINGWAEPYTAYLVDADNNQIATANFTLDWTGLTGANLTNLNATSGETHFQVYDSEFNPVAGLLSEDFKVFESQEIAIQAGDPFYNADTYSIVPTAGTFGSGSWLRFHNPGYTPSYTMIMVADEKTLAVAGQNGTITAGEAAQSATFDVVTANIEDNQAVTIQWFTTAAGDVSGSAPTGVTAAGSNVSSGVSTITVNADAASQEGSYYFKATADGVTSEVVTLVVSPAPEAVGINGTVRDVNGDPIAGVDVRIGGKTAVTDASGAYAITDAPEGSQYIQLYADFYHHNQTPYGVNVPGTYDAVMIPAGKITGTINLQGTLPANSYIAVQISEHNNLDDAIVSGNSFSVRGVPIGPKTLSFTLVNANLGQSVYISPTEGDHTLAQGVVFNLGNESGIPVTNSTFTVPVTHPNGDDDGIIDMGTIKLIYSDES